MTVRSSLPGFERSGGGVLERGSEEKAKERGEQVAGVLIVLMHARGESSRLCLGRATATARWRPAGARCCVARQGRHNAKAKSGGGGRARRVGGQREQEVLGWPSTAVTALNSGGVEQSRQASWRKGKRDQFAISEISGTLL